MTATDPHHAASMHTDETHRPHEHHRSGTGSGERAFGGPVVIDVGPGAGALVVHLERRWLDHELHLHALDRAGWSTHTGVWERRLDRSRRVVAAVFPSLPVGGYGILDHDGRSVLRVVDVTEGGVTEVDLR